MTQYREILRLTAMGLSQRCILDSVGCSQKTVVKVQRRARELKLSWPLDDAVTDAVLEETLFPKAPKVSSTKQMPDLDYIRRELQRNGVNKKLLWTEYLETCRQSGGEPLMYSQFCYYWTQIDKFDEVRPSQQRSSGFHFSGFAVHVLPDRRFPPTGIPA